MDLNTTTDRVDMIEMDVYTSFLRVVPFAHRRFGYNDDRVSL